jgi:hypothetical protein
VNSPFKINAEEEISFEFFARTTNVAQSHLDMKKFFLAAAFCFANATPIMSDEIKIGIIGTDTSHSPAFTELLNNPEAKGHVTGAKVVAAFKGGSPDIKSSASRVDEFAKTLKEKHGLKFYDSIEELAKNVDAICIESVDGRPHLEQFKAVMNMRKPVFIDKPMAGSLRDVIEIFRLAKKYKVPVFSSSGLRFGKDSQLVRSGKIGKVSYAETYGPCEIEPHHPDLFWYGVHGVEALYTVVGTGCDTVKRGKTAEGKIEVVGSWPSGRKGIFREEKGFHGHAKGEFGEADVGSFDGYAPLVAEIVKFFKTKKPPVSSEETIEIFAFMEAADESKAHAGAEIRIKDVLKKNGFRK